MSDENESGPAVEGEPRRRSRKYGAQVVVRLPVALYDEIAKAAAMNERTVAQEVRLRLRKFGESSVP